MNPRQYRFTGWFIHLLVWAVVFCIPMFMFGPGRPMLNGRYYAGYFILPLSFAGVFYVNYCFLIRRCLFEKRIWRFLLSNAVMISAMMFAVHVLSQDLLPPPSHTRPEPPPVHALLGFVGRNAVLYVFVICISVAVKMTSSWYQADNERKELEHRKTEAELQNLKSQVNPHFLFNTLNNIYSLIQFDTGRAQQAVMDLSRMLRYVLYDSSSPLVPLNDEILFLNDYIGLMRLRLPAGVTVTVSLPDGRSAARIAPLLFISLVENAFKHGVSSDRPSFIDIGMKDNDGVVEFRCRNSCFPKESSDRSGSGIGLANLSKRLDLTYPGRHEFRYGEKDGEYEAYLKIDTVA